MMNKSRWYLKLVRQTSGKYALFLHKHESSPGYIIIHLSVSISTNFGWTDEYKFLNQSYVEGEEYGVFLPEENLLFSASGNYLPHGSLIIMCHMSNDAIKIKFDQCFLKSLIMNGKLVHYSPKQEYHGAGPSSWRSTDHLSLLRSPQFLSKVCQHIQSGKPKKERENKNTQTDTEKSKNIFNDTEDLLHFFAEKKFCYVTLRTPNKEFAVHKALICARSPVFCAMFDNSMRENQENIVDIDDVDSDTLTKLLRFLHLEPLGYTNWETTTKLYYAADKYQIQELKNRCRSLLKNKLTAENVCDLFVLSDMHQDEELKQRAQSYFCNHSKNILCTEEWKNLLLNKAELAYEVLRKYAANL